MVEQFTEELIENYQTADVFERKQIYESAQCNLNNYAWLLKTFDEIDEEYD